MSSSGRTINSLETFESDDKLFSKHILEEGQGDSKPNDGSICVVFISPIGNDDNTEIAETILGDYKLNEDVEIVIGEGDSLLSELLDKVVVTMREGEMSYIKTRVDLNCRKVEDLPGQKSALKFNVQLKSFSRAADMGELESDEKLERAEHHKKKGTEIYQLNNVEFGVRRFKKALQYLESIESVDRFSPSMVSQMKTLKCHCNLNLAAGYLKQEQFEKVISHCNEALKLEPKNVKGLFRRGQAYASLNKYMEARQDLLCAKELDANNTAVHALLKKVEISIKKERQMYQKMFSQ